MATNFLIALATALGSATFILLVLRVVLKAVVPNAFKEMIAIPEKVVERQFTETVKTPDEVQMRPVIIDDATLLALSGRQIVDLLGNREQPLQVIYNISSFTPEISGMQTTSLLSSRWQGARSFIVVEGKIPKARETEEKKALSREEILSPPGQSTANFGSAVKKSVRAPNETLCGSAS